jgi:hypothetical protein
VHRPNEIKVNNSEDTVLVKPELADCLLPRPPMMNLPPCWFRKIGEQSAWPWRLSIEELRSKLSELLKSHVQLVLDGPLGREAFWKKTLILLGKNPNLVSPIAVEDIMEHLDRIPKGHGTFSDGKAVYDLGRYKRQLELYTQRGEKEFRPPWPVPDLEPPGTSFWAWSVYSNERLLERTTEIFEGAIEGYLQLVEAWFANFAQRLTIASTLPARLTGYLALPEHDRGPTLTWYWEALPSGSASEFNICIDDRDEPPPEAFKSWERTKELRPAAAPWIGATINSEILNIWHNDPATRIAYRWLWDDLNNVNWVTGSIGWI